MLTLPCSRLLYGSGRIYPPGPPGFDHQSAEDSGALPRGRRIGGYVCRKGETSPGIRLLCLSPEHLPTFSIGAGLRWDSIHRDSDCAKPLCFWGKFPVAGPGVPDLSHRRRRVQKAQPGTICPQSEGILEGNRGIVAGPAHPQMALGKATFARKIDPLGIEPQHSDPPGLEAGMAATAREMKIG